MKSQRQDRWLWVDRDSNHLLFLESRMPDPWASKAEVMVTIKKTSGHGFKALKIPTACKIIVFQTSGNADFIPAIIDRRIYTARFAYSEASNLLLSLAFPSTETRGESPIWLGYDFGEHQ